MPFDLTKGQDTTLLTFVRILACTLRLTHPLQ